MLRRFVLATMAMFALIGTAGFASAGVNVRVDLASQRIQIDTSDGESYNWAISSGRDGFRTIRGTFQPTRLEKKWYSRKYGGNMPNAIFFRGGFAIHGTGAVGMLGRPASHGCVRLHPANAAKLFALVQKHGKGATRIAINGVAPDSNSKFAKAKSERNRVVTAKAKQKAPNWDVVRGRVLERDGRIYSGPALGFRPVSPPAQNWYLWR